jgi:glycosyltransferase involved in cell wall biosynthesis
MTLSSRASSLLIVVPTLNSYALLPRLLRSLQQQTWSNWQLIFIDGPSGQDHRNWIERCCADEARCSWIEQDPAEQGIYGAMNQGFAVAADPASEVDWLLFWGSDDWAASPNVLSEAMGALDQAAYGTNVPDMIVASGRYADASTPKPIVLGRTTMFQPAGILDSFAFRRALLLGSTPPHQATFFGVGARRHLARYDVSFRLSADLDYFLRLSSQCVRNSSDLCVQCLDLELIHMAGGGISAQQTQCRLQEVRRAYQRAFGWRWWFPFFARYARRLFSKISCR